MFNKTQLIERAKHYFDNKKVKVMYATPDGNFFHENAKSYADSHARSNELEVIAITREDLAEPKKAEDSNEIVELRKEAKKLGIKGFGIMSVEKLNEKIAEKK